MTSAHDGLQNTQHHENINFINGTRPGEEAPPESGLPLQDDLALENAIGDAFKQFALFGSEHAQNTETQGDTALLYSEEGTAGGNTSVKTENPEDFSAADQGPLDMDLENAVGDLFSSFAKDNNLGTTDDQSGDSHQPVASTSENGSLETNLPASLSEDTKQSNSSTGTSDPVQNSALDLVQNNSGLSNVVDSHNDGEIEEATPLSPTPTESINASAHQFSAELPQPKDPNNIEGNLSAPADQNHQEITEHHTEGLRTSPKPSVSEPETGDVTQKDSPLESGAVSGGEDDDDLENAIGDAFKNLVEDMNNNVETSPQPQTQPETDSANQDELDDNNLEEAIGAAFKSLAGDFGGEQNEFSRNPDPEILSESSDSGNQPSHGAPALETNDSESSDNHMDIDIGDIVQNVVLQMGDLDNTTGHGHTLSISKDILHNLASEISNQVHTSESSDLMVHGASETEPGSQNDVEEDDPSQDLDAALKAAVANAMKSAFPSGNTNITSHINVTSDKELDLEQLQMNEILQNAFNMAMQNPQDLLTSLDLGDESGTKENDDADRALKNVLASATAIAAQSVKESFEKSKQKLASQAVSEKKSSDTQKPLSIAETLALHRSNMTSSHRDYSTIKSLEDSRQTGERASFQPSSQNHPQLSNILSSLSQHIQSGTHSSNLMLVIRQMTNALMHNKKFPPTFSKGGQELIKNIKNSGDNRDFFIANMRRAKTYILGMTGDDNKIKALTLVENILDSIETKKQKNGPEEHDTDQLTEKAEGDLARYFDAAFSTLTNLDISRLRNTIEGVKPDVDSSEHKIRIREGNRERKKKWREENAERNKDNDLRCRVLKRAALKFGETSSDEKLSWIEKEYTKRRNRRISRQKKDDVKTESPPPSDDSPAQDPLLVQRITDSFNLISECGFDEDPRAVLLAISATTATFGLSCAEILNIQDPLVIVNAISLILISIFDHSLKSGASRKFVFLIKRQDNQFGLKNPQEMTKEELLRKFSALNALNPSSGSEFSPAMSALEALRQSQKRLELDFADSTPKRPKTDISNGYTESERHLMADSRELVVNSSGINSWNNSSSLRMPQYKKPSATGITTDPELLKMDNSRREFVEPIPKIASPFISNKLGNDTGKYSAPKSFKKPGNLQRPGFSKPANKSNNLGFPTLYSTSFRLN